jgi:hypothetical protein
MVPRADGLWRDAGAEYLLMPFATQLLRFNRAAGALHCGAAVASERDRRWGGGVSDAA